MFLAAVDKFPTALVAWASLAALSVAIGIAMGPRVIGILILKYLRRRIIAWAALISVMLCTTVVLVSISVMGGWLRMLEESTRGLTGDLIIRTDSLAGFGGYQEIVTQVEQLHDVVAAVPTLETFGLINIGGQKSTPVQVIGLPIDKIGHVNAFPMSLWRQHRGPQERLDQLEAERKKIARKSSISDASRKKQLAEIDADKAVVKAQLNQPPTFEPRDPVEVYAILPDAAKSTNLNTGALSTGDPELDRKVRYLASTWAGSPEGTLIASATLTDADVSRLQALAPDDKAWAKSVIQLARQSNYPGMIASTGVLEIRKNERGETVGREAFKYRLTATLKVLGVSPEGQIDPSNRADTSYRIVDDSHTGMWQSDGDSVYVPFDVLQRDLGMGPIDETDNATGKTFTEPARTSQIHVRLKEDADIQVAKTQVQAIVDKAIAAEQQRRRVLGQPPAAGFGHAVRVETWREAGEKYINAVEHEKVLMVVLFSLLSIVAIFLILCIFYMVVTEKTRDIGIIKSVGATSTHIAAVFLGYGMFIGILGGGLGLLISYCIVHNINEIHAWMGAKMGVQMWNPELYAFDKIPSTMNPSEAAIVVTLAALLSVLGALIPALRAAWLNPVSALRWE